MQPCFAQLGYRKGDFPESELAADCTLALPVYPELTVTQQNRVVEAMQAFYRSTGHLSMRRAA
jgi:dTDP-4-amino-4,6-dideoxygalactose transaminase